MFRYMFTKRDHVSYAQTGEDRIIWNTLSSMKKGSEVFYVDIGAHHPVNISNTYLFYRLGGRGITVEPNADMAARHRRVRPRDTLIQAAVTAEPQDCLRFFHFDASSMSTADAEQAERLQAEGKFKLIRTEEVPAVNLDSIAEQLAGKSVDLLSIDIEGEQFSIVEGLIRRGVSPLFICCETIDYDGSENVRKDTDVIAAIKSLGYDVFADTLINTIFARKGSLPFTVT